MRDFGRKHAIQILGLISLGFIVLSVLILVFPHSWLDSEFSEEIQEHHNAVIDSLMKGISWFGKLWPSVILVLGSTTLLLLFKKKREAIYCAATLFIGLITYLVKTLINRPRPDSALVRVIVDTQHQSFPSGHVSFYIVFFGFIAFLFYHHKWLLTLPRNLLIFFCLFLILTIPISRIYLGAHWFTDVLGGFLLGSLFLGVLLQLYLKKEHH
jgi:membrane-associated phospholipid phosphatase